MATESIYQALYAKCPVLRAAFVRRAVRRRGPCLHDPIGHAADTKSSALALSAAGRLGASMALAEDQALVDAFGLAACLVVATDGWRVARLAARASDGRRFADHLRGLGRMVGAYGRA